MQWKPKLLFAMVLPVDSLFFLSADSTGASSHYLFIASNRPLNEYNRVSFLHAIPCYHKSTDNVTFSIDSGVMSVQKYINSYAEAVEFHCN